MAPLPPGVPYAFIKLLASLEGLTWTMRVKSRNISNSSIVFSSKFFRKLKQIVEESSAHNVNSFESMLI